MSSFVDAGLFRQQYLRGLVDFIPAWGEDQDYHLKINVYKEQCKLAKDTIKFPAESIFCATSKDDSPMGNEGLDGRFSDGSDGGVES